MKKKVVKKQQELEKALEPVTIRLTTTVLKTVSYRGDERDTTKWINDFCSDKGTSITHVSVTNDGRAFTAFVSYWSEE